MCTPSLGSLTSAGAKPPSAPLLDSGNPVAARVSAVLGAMTLAEKVGQMDQQLVAT
jgi:hypothetical protein